MLFLANIQPDLQREVREQCTGARLAGLDSMNLWIETARDSLVRTIGTVDMVLMNDDEVRMLTEQPTLLRAAREVMEMGPRIVVVKQGEYGAALFTADGFFSLPAYPLETVIDPTGAGDCFAGGFLGYLASEGSAADDAALRRAMTFGSVVASFNVEQFGTERIQTLTRDEIDERYEDFRRMTAIEPGATALSGAVRSRRDERLLGGLLARGGAEDPDRRAALHRLVGGQGPPPDAWTGQDEDGGSRRDGPHPRLVPRSLPRRGPHARPTPQAARRACASLGARRGPDEPQRPRVAEPLGARAAPAHVVGRAAAVHVRPAAQPHPLVAVRDRPPADEADRPATARDRHGAPDVVHEIHHAP